MEMGSRQGISITRTDDLKRALPKLYLILGYIKRHNNTGKSVSSGATLQNK